MDDRLQVNRESWNERVPVHAASDYYDVEGFKLGRITLTEIERREIGSVSGKTLLHLQCHFGLDTMLWSRLGAKATGVDFSEAAIDLARGLNDELKLGVRFIRSNIYDLPDVLEERFDIVFTSYGALIWLPDIARWAQVVSNHLKPGGVFYIIESHPFATVFEPSESGDMVPAYRYIHHEMFFEGGDPSYAGAQIIETPTYEWQHTLGDIVTALIDAGLRIEFLHEFPFTCYQAYPVMERGDDGWWRLPKHNDSFPQMFSIRATKEGKLLMSSVKRGAYSLLLCMGLSYYSTLGNTFATQRAPGSRPTSTSTAYRPPFASTARLRPSTWLLEGCGWCSLTSNWECHYKATHIE